MAAFTLVTDHALIEEILAPHRLALGWWYEGLRNHAYRMLNFGRCFAPPSPMSKRPDPWLTWSHREGSRPRPAVPRPCAGSFCGAGDRRRESLWAPGHVP